MCDHTAVLEMKEVHGPRVVPHVIFLHTTAAYLRQGEQTWIWSKKQEDELLQLVTFSIGEERVRGEYPEGSGNHPHHGNHQGASRSGICGRRHQSARQSYPDH